MPTAYVALGSNLGDRHAHLRHALHRLREAGGTVTGGSPIYETEPVGGPDGQGPYLNAVLELETALSPRDLLDRLLDLEAERGRTREVRWDARTLDLDLLWYDGAIIDEPGLTVPHPEIENRPFVLVPLAEVEPRLEGPDGAYSDLLPGLDVTGMRRISGPLAPEADRWMVGLADAIALSADDGVSRCVAHEDWANTSGDAFGGYLAAVALESVRNLRGGGRPSHLTYRYLLPVPTGSELEISTAVHRVGRSSTDLTVSLSVGDRVVGRCAVGVIDRPLERVVAPPAPDVLPMAETVPVAEYISGTDRPVGASLRSWGPLERWDVPDLRDGSEDVLRAWSSNVVMGEDDIFLHAATITMPIDALIWPATMQALGRLPDGPLQSTPTIELTARFADFGTDPWYLGEAEIDHITDRTVTGTVRVWGSSGEYLAVGHSLNLLRG